MMVIRAVAGNEVHAGWRSIMEEGNMIKKRFPLKVLEDDEMVTAT
jgi:hypothetical protein